MKSKSLDHFVNHNGRFYSSDTELLRVDNRAFRYGWGLYETMLVREGKVRLGHYHWERLMDGAERIGMRLPALVNEDYLLKEVLKTAEKNGMGRLARMRLQLYAGEGGLREMPQKCGFVIECFDIEEHITQLNEAGLTVGIATEVRKAVDNISNIKSASSMLYAVAANEARRNRWNDALILNTEGQIIESTIANIFWIMDEVVYTPPLSDGCVAGVMRRHLLNILDMYGIAVKECSLRPHDLPHISEIFLTNAIRGIKWITCTNGNNYEGIRVRKLVDRIIKAL